MITSQFAAIYSLSDTSIQIQPIVTCSLSDNTELLAGASLNFGEHPHLV